MKSMLLALFTVIGLSLVTVDVEAARRMGGGGNVGKQREMMQPPAKSPTQAPAAAPAQQAQPQKSGMSKWLGPLAGLAIGAGLASLFLNNGFAGAMAGILMMVLLAAAIFFLVRMFRNRSRPQTLNYATLGNAPGGAPSPQPDLSTRFGGGAVEPTLADVTHRYPPGFDAEQFLQHAKVNFKRLQEIHDQRDLSGLRDFMTPELYADINADVGARGTTPQKTEVVALDADVIEVVTERDSYIASVRFKGTLRDAASGEDESFSEVWHLQKPINGRTGWLISGIQQD